MNSQNQPKQQETSLKLLAAISLVFLLIALGQYLGFVGVDATAQQSAIKLGKFSASLAIYAATMLWLLRQLSSADKMLTWAAASACLGGVSELSTLLIQTLAPSWQSSALVVISRIAILPPTFLIIVTFKLLFKEDMPQALRRALLWATGLTIFGCLPGVLMLIEISHHQSSYGLVELGGLKLAHFIGLHTLQLMPMAHFLVSKQICNREKQIKAIDRIGLALLALIALLTISSTSENTQAIALAILTLCAVFLTTTWSRKTGRHNTTFGGNILFSRSKF